jgi:2-methylisocitrate lyase-like PEP mutase family enzyme
MTNAASIEVTAARADALRALHAGPQLLALPNAWDAATARVFEAAGFPAVATTSGGVAQSLGYADHEAAPVEEMLAAAARIARAVTVPVSVDFEAGYRLAPREIARRLIAVGAAGMNLEDSDHHGAGPLVAAETHAERLAALKAAARSEGVDLVLNARVDVFVHRRGTPGEQLAEGIRRARLYREAGADCVYPILLGDPTMLAALVEAAGVVNVNLRRGGPLGPGHAAALGVRRVTWGASLFRETLGSLERIAGELRAEVPPDDPSGQEGSGIPSASIAPARPSHSR